MDFVLVVRFQVDRQSAVQPGQHDLDDCVCDRFYGAELVLCCLRATRGVAWEKGVSCNRVTAMVGQGERRYSPGPLGYVSFVIVYRWLLRGMRTDFISSWLGLL